MLECGRSCIAAQSVHRLGGMQAAVFDCHRRCHSPVEPFGSSSAQYIAALERMRLVGAGDTPHITPLTGGVSSDIVRVDLRTGPICVKRALSRLKVEADWQAPVERNRYELEWLKTAGRIVPHAVPQVLGEDRDSGMFAMTFLDPRAYPVWKTQLRDGTVVHDFAVAVGRCIARIHSCTAGDSLVRELFSTDHIFFPIRLEPYLVATARAHPNLASRFDALVHTTASTKHALVHGDVSPKNILAGPRGPIFVDAECAWYGDPAFDLAFCLNHLLLKCLWRPHLGDRYLASYMALAQAYLAEVNWEPIEALEARAAQLLPALLLARIDGKSPVEYVYKGWQRDAVRRAAGMLLMKPADTLAQVRDAWAAEARTFPTDT